MIKTLAILGALAHIEIEGAPEVIDGEGHAFTPTLACWTASHYDWHARGAFSLYCVLRDSYDQSGAAVAYSGEDIPDWVPTPPPGWDAAVVAASGRMAS